MSSETPPSPIDFDRADFVNPPATVGGRLLCALCMQPIDRAYYELGGKIICENCRARVVASTDGGSSAARFFKALAAGTLGGILGTAIYGGVFIVTGYELGLIALVVGLLVGGAVRWGSSARGGWFYQLMAIAITYVSIAASYIAAAAAQAAKEGNSLDAILPIDPLAIAVVLALPVMVGIEAPIGLLIVGFALFEAWKINRRTVLPVSGPFSVAASAPPPPALPPPPPGP